jgi:nucleotide-binding universal stress UspA family protein
VVENMMSKPRSRTVLLAAVDQTKASEEVITTAVTLSCASPEGELHFVHVVDPKFRRPTPAAPVSDLMATANAYLDRIVGEVGGVTPSRVACHLGIGDPVTSILQLSVDVGADLLIVGTHGKRGLSWLTSSVSRKLLRRAPCAVLLARARGEGDLVPQLDPPCAACVDTRFATAGENLWCAEHAAHHVRGHLHHGSSKGYGAGAMFLRSDDL